MLIHNSILEINEIFTIFMLENEYSNLNTYFDTYEIIDIIQGIRAFELYHKFDFDRFKGDLSVLVHSFAFKGFYGEIALLPSHQMELSQKIMEGGMFRFGNKIDMHFKLIEDEFLCFLGLEEILNDLDSADEKKITYKYLENLKTRADELFKAEQLLGTPFWLDRLKHMYNSNLLILKDGSKNNIRGIIKTNLFKKIKTAFDKARPQSSFQKSNYVDALAMYHLQKELDKYKSSQKNAPLPIFYSSSKGIHKAIKILKESDRELFHYQLDGSFIPIIRNSLYFILFPIFSDTPNKELESVFSDDLREKQKVIQRIIAGRYKEFNYIGEILEKKWIDFELGIKELINIEFIKKIWLKDKAKEQFNNSLKKFRDYRLKAENIGEYVSMEGEEIIEKLKNDYYKADLLTKIFNTFRGVKDELFKYLDFVDGLDVYRDFGLIRFGLTPLNDRKIQQFTLSLINSVGEEDERSEFKNRISEIATFFLDDVNDAEGTENLITGLAVLWILEKHQLITHMCERIMPRYPRYEIALIHAASLGMLQTRKALKIPEVFHIINNNNSPNYKIWIGKAYAYFRVWEKLRDDIPVIPEKCSKKQWSQIMESKEYKDYCLMATHLAKKAVDHLKKIKDTDIDKIDTRRRSYLYILNSYIYYICKTGSENQFIEIKHLYDEFRGYETIQRDWQGRFYDTLSWYNLRRSIIEENLDFLLIAKDYNNKARERIATPRDEGVYQQVKELIAEFQHEFFN